MFPFTMQTKLAEAWLDAAAASFALAGSMGAAAARGFNPRLPGAHPSYAFSFWTPVMTPVSAWPWSWFAGFGSPAPTNWWQAPLSFYGDWMRTFTYGATANGWLMSPQAWTAAFPLARSYSAFLTPFALTSPQYFPSPADTASMIAASYRTASGHATAAMFDALMPRQTSWTSASWKHSPAWMFAR
ncbi:MAG: hypothetical protein ABWZ74_10900 [Hyphomicrobiaceae bacterium]